MTKKYFLHCKKCKNKQNQIITSRSRKRGVKLTCMNCNSVSCWSNFIKLEEGKSK